LYLSSKGTIAGEGAFMVWMDNQRSGASAEIHAVKTLHSMDRAIVEEGMKQFISENLPAGENPDLLMTGENGDERMNPFLKDRILFPASMPIARFKHLCGEYCTASSFACWLSMQIFQSGKIPPLLIKKNPSDAPVEKIIIYNNYRGLQHSFILISGVDR
jgi:hypothetical protein